MVQRTEDPAEAARSLTDQALHYSSEDNATAIVIPLGSWGTNRLTVLFYKSSFIDIICIYIGNNTTSASIFYSFGRSMTVSSRFS